MKPTGSQKKPRQFDVVILGAGISGLSAAYEIKKRNPKLTIAILEARDRIGGRIFSINLNQNLVSEHGAEWIGKTHKNLLRFCKEFKLKLEPHTYQECSYFQKRKHIPDTAYISAMKKLENALKKYKSLRGKKFSKLDHLSIRKMIASVCNQHELKIINEYYKAEFGEDIRYVAATRAILDHLTGGKNSHMDFHVVGGNTKIIQALGSFVGNNNIFLKQEVKKIKQNVAGAQIICANGSVWSAKKIICTIPATILSHVKFEPAMPKHMKGTLKKLRYGNIVKIILLFPKRFWKKEGYSHLSEGITEYLFHTTQGQKDKEGALSIFATGKRANELTKMSLVQIWDIMKNSFPPDINTKGIKPKKMFRHSWTHDRFAKGAYAVYHPDEWEKMHKYFGVSYKHVYFAGEYIAKMQGFMEGAAASGIESAKNVMRILK